MGNDLLAEAVVLSVEVFKNELREGMRKVRVTVDLKDRVPRQITLEEWVPVVLFSRLAVGKTVLLIEDPRQEGRVTLGL